MKPNQLRLMTKPGTGRVYIVHEKPGQRPQVLKDVTDDFVLMQAADILAEGGVGMETTYQVTHPNGDEIEVDMTFLITRNERGPR